jgi:transcriptional regulator with XRE-family HTH domain
MSRKSKPKGDVARNVRAELARRNVTQTDLARLLGLSNQAMSRRIVGEVGFRDQELIKIAKLLGVDVASLFGGGGQPQPQHAQPVDQVARARRHKQASEAAELMRKLADTTDVMASRMRAAANTADIAARQMRQFADTMEMPEWSLADRLGKALRESGISVNDAAERLGVHRNTVSSWINGRVPPSASAVQAIADATGVSYDWLCGDEDGGGATGSP